MIQFERFETYRISLLNEIQSNLSLLFMDALSFVFKTAPIKYQGIFL